MNIFHEIYSVYYRIAGRLLSLSELTSKDVNRMIYRYAFMDSKDILTSKLIPKKDGSDWKLFVDTGDGKMAPVVKHPPVNVLTLLQKRWLAAKLNDPKMKLFLDDESIAGLRRELGDVKPLYSSRHFRYTDRFTDGDDTADENYIRNFRTVLSAVREGKLLKIKYFAENSARYIVGIYQPLKIEYSPKNDKFRVLCRRMSKGRSGSCTVINMGSIIFASPADIGTVTAADMEKYYAKCRAAEPVVVRVTNERNGVERFLTEFSSYEKHTVRDLETGECTTEIYYDKRDETELLIRLLSFGPVIEIMAPAHFRRAARERVMKQYELFH